MRWLEFLFIGVFVALAARAQESWAAIETAAREEGRLVIYSGALAHPVFPQVVKRFEQLYGIRTEVLDGRPTELRERIRAERAASRVMADVSHNGTTTTALMLRDGVLAPHGPLPNAARIDPRFAVDGTVLPTFLVRYGLLLNNRLVPPGQEPQSWGDLLDPRWRRKVIADDLRSLGAGAVFVAVMIDHFGEEFHGKFAQQEPMLSMESRLNEPRVARGERPIYLPFPLANMPELRGLPVRAWVPREGTPYVRFDTAMIAGAPRPNAAKLFLDFLLRDEVQALYANRGFGPVVARIKVDASSAAAAFEQAPLMGTTDPARIEHVLEVAKVYSK